MPAWQKYLADFFWVADVSMALGRGRRKRVKEIVPDNRQFCYLHMSSLGFIKSHSVTHQVFFFPLPEKMDFQLLRADAFFFFVYQYIVNTP